MDLGESITAAMEEINRRPKVTHNEEVIQRRGIDITKLSQEEEDFYKLMFGDDIAAVRHLKLHCTACDVHIGSAPSKFSNMFAHPVLFTLLCAACRSFYGDGNFEQGEDATDMFCRWCANGGNLYCCSYCSNTFCNKCIKRNFDPVVRKKIEDEEKWKCFVCDPTDLYTARAVCWALSEHVQNVTRILGYDKNITLEDYTEKMNLDESKCCSRRRTKVKRRKISTTRSDNEEDETYHPSLEEMSSSSRRRSGKNSTRSSLLINGDEKKSTPITRSLFKPKSESENYNEEEDEDLLPPPMIACVQSMVEGENSETVNETIINPQEVYSAPPTLQINPIPTANLLKVVPPSAPQLTQMKSNSFKRKRKRTLQHVLPAAKGGLAGMKNSSQAQSSTQTQALPTVECSSLSLRPPSTQSNVPMVAIPSSKNSTTLSSRSHTIEYSALPLRVPNVQSSGTKQIPSCILVQKPKPASTSADKDVGVIELGSDSDEPEIQELVSRDKSKTDDSALRRSREILKNVLNNSLQEHLKFPELNVRRAGDKNCNKVEQEIDLRTDEVRTLFRMIGTKLRKVPLLHFPNHNDLRSTRVKARRFHLAMTKAISALSDINDKVVHKYSDWRKSMLEESRQTESGGDNSTSVNETTNDKDDNNDELNLPLDMICTNSESESDINEECDSDSMLIGEKGVMSVKSFQERDTVDIGVGGRVSTADKSVQAFDVVERDYEKCIGHSVLTKVEYDPVDGSEILKPVIVPAEYNGKFEEQFIFYLQRREENEIETDEDKGLPDPNETPLRDLIEANSPFILEMLESIDSPLASGITNELEDAIEESDESGKENEEQSEPTTNVVKELAKMVTELSEDLITSRESESFSKKHSEHGKKDRRKEKQNEDNEEEERERESDKKPKAICKNMESKEVDIAVRTLIEEDERSRSSSNDDEIISHNIKQIKKKIDGKKKALIEYGEDECTIIE